MNNNKELKCDNCGGPVDPETLRCNYCGHQHYLEKEIVTKTETKIETQTVTKVEKEPIICAPKKEPIKPTKSNSKRGLIIGICLSILILGSLIGIALYPRTITKTQTVYVTPTPTPIATPMPTPTLTATPQLTTIPTPTPYPIEVNVTYSGYNPLLSFVESVQLGNGTQLGNVWLVDATLTAYGGTVYNLKLNVIAYDENNTEILNTTLNVCAQLGDGLYRTIYQYIPTNMTSYPTNYTYTLTPVWTNSP